MLTIEGLQRCCKTQQGKERCVVFAALLAEIMPLWLINTPGRQAMFIAQVLHESGEFKWLAEIGSNAYLSKYDTGRLALRLGNTPEADGDGQLYKGRGLIQITGRYNYQQCGHALQLNLLKNPHLLENPRHAVASAVITDYPIGVHLVKGKYAANCCLNGKTKYLGSFDHPQEAYAVYKQFKEKLCKELAKKWYGQIDHRVYDAMMVWTV